MRRFCHTKETGFLCFQIKLRDSKLFLQRNIRKSNVRSSLNIGLLGVHSGNRRALTKLWKHWGDEETAFAISERVAGADLDYISKSGLQLIAFYDL